VLVLEAEGDENVAEALQGGVLEKVGGEIDGELGRILAELADEGRAVQGPDETDQLLNLFVPQHQVLVLKSKG
jgi:hypothetical protein